MQHDIDDIMQDDDMFDMEFYNDMLNSSNELVNKAQVMFSDSEERGCSGEDYQSDLLEDDILGYDPEKIFLQPVQESAILSEEDARQAPEPVPEQKVQKVVLRKKANRRKLGEEAKVRRRKQNRESSKRHRQKKRSGDGTSQWSYSELLEEVESLRQRVRELEAGQQA
jgi:hypothetical protein